MTAINVSLQAAFRNLSASYELQEVLWLQYDGLDTFGNPVTPSFFLDPQRNGSFLFRWNNVGSAIYSSPGLFPTDGTVFGLQWRIAITSFASPGTLQLDVMVNNATVWSTTFGGFYRFTKFRRFYLQSAGALGGGAPLSTGWDNLQIYDSAASINNPATAGVSLAYGCSGRGPNTPLAPCVPYEIPEPPACVTPTISAVTEGGIVIPESTPAPTETCPEAILMSDVDTYLSRIHPLPQNTGDWTVMVWFMVTGALATNYRTALVLFPNGIEDYITPAMWMGTYDDGFGVESATINMGDIQSTLVPIAQNTWMHLAVTYDASANLLTFFSDAVAQAVTITHNLAATIWTRSYAGGDGHGDANSDVAVSYVRFFPFTLTAGEIAAEMVSRRAVLSGALLDTPLEALTHLGGWTAAGTPTTVAGPLFVQPTIGGIQ